MSLFFNDITFCADDCLNTECFRHKSRAPIGEPRSMSHLKGTTVCEMEYCDTCRFLEEEDGKEICAHPLLDEKVILDGNMACDGWMRKSD